MPNVRTQEQIVQRMEEVKDRDFFGFERSDLIEHLDFERAKPYLKDGVTREQWDAREIEDPVEVIKKYMDFAWEKALGERGLSAGRTISHLQAWLCLAGEDGLLAFAEDDANYPMYGVPILRRVCEHYQLPIPEDA